MMDFVFCTDKNYLKGYGVLMLSLLQCAPPPSTQEQLRFHILSDDLDDADKAALLGLAAGREGASVAFYEPAKELSKATLENINASLSRQSHWTKETYYRILAADLLPPDVHTALYLDGDVLCTGSLDGLFATDLAGFACGKCCSSRYLNARQYNLLGYPPEEGYFNSGVMLINLDLWRKENTSRAMFDYLAANLGKPIFYDQDVINAVLHGKILPLDFSYNVTHSLLYVYYWINEEKNDYYARDTQHLPREDWPAALAAVERPRLIHFTGNPKPWFRGCPNPFASVWRSFCAASPWKDEPLSRYKPKLEAKARIKRMGRRALEKINLVAKQGIPYPEEARKAAQRVLDELRESGQIL